MAPHPRILAFFWHAVTALFPGSFRWRGFMPARCCVPPRTPRPGRGRDHHDRHSGAPRRSIRHRARRRIRPGERVVTACQKKARTPRCGADDGPDYYPCLASFSHDTRGCPSTAGEGRRKPACTPSRQSFGTTRRSTRRSERSHLGSPLKPGRPVLTLGVSRRRRISGLCSCRRLTERGASNVNCR